MTDVKVEWRPNALDDRDAIIKYLEPLNPHAAVNLLQALVLAGDASRQFSIQMKSAKYSISGSVIAD